MFKFIIFCLIISSFSSCQTSQESHNHNKMSQRSLASADMWRTLIGKIANTTKTSEKAVEKSILDYLKREKANNQPAVSKVVGITQSEAKGIITLSDELPYMNKVKDWAMRNLDLIFPKIPNKVLVDIYAPIAKSKELPNTYLNRQVVNTGVKRKKRKKGSKKTKTTHELPRMSSLSQKKKDVLEMIEKILDDKLKVSLKETLNVFEKRGKLEPEIAANGHVVIESAIVVYNKTGRISMGIGCKTFSENVSSAILASKANVDLFRAELIRDLATNKAARPFGSFNEVAPKLRLSEAEIDKATIEAFKKVLNQTDDIATGSLRKLKKGFCKVY